MELQRKSAEKQFETHCEYFSIKNKKSEELKKNMKSNFFTFCFRKEKGQNLAAYRTADKMLVVAISWLPFCLLHDAGHAIL